MGECIDQRLLIEHNESDMASFAPLLDEPPSTTAPPKPPVPCEEAAVRAWLKESGFLEGDLHGFGVDLANGSGFDMTPLSYACFKGELGVCKWLYENGAAADISKGDDYADCKPMLYA